MVVSDTQPESNLESCQLKPHVCQAHRGTLLDICAGIFSGVIITHSHWFLRVHLCWFVCLMSCQCRRVRAWFKAIDRFNKQLCSLILVSWPFCQCSVDYGDSFFLRFLTALKPTTCVCVSINIFYVSLFFCPVFHSSSTLSLCTISFQPLSCWEGDAQTLTPPLSTLLFPSVWPCSNLSSLLSFLQTFSLEPLLLSFSSCVHFFVSPCPFKSSPIPPFFCCFFFFSFPVCPLLHNLHHPCSLQFAQHYLFLWFLKPFFIICLFFFFFLSDL